MWGKDPTRDTLPVAGDEERAMPNARRTVARWRAESPIPPR